ncbi:hypothetical protein HZA57_02500, partial [Candidatus Poribacteria bacterium]|nr:hypothetical protein [Candidatus Poribacteria bacterium]
VLDGKNISGIAGRGSTIVISVNIADNFIYGNIGIFRSTNGGTDFTQISTGNGSTAGLPGGAAFDLASDPTDNARLYTSIVFAPAVGGVNAIYKSTDTGATWTKVSDTTMDALITDNVTNNLEMGVGNSGEVYAGIIRNGQLAGLFRSATFGSSWTQLDSPATNENGTLVGLQPNEHAGSQGSIHFSIRPSPTNANLVFLGGDRQPLSDGANSGTFPNSIGAENYSGRLFRVDASLTAGSQATPLTHNPSTASNSAPHADSREMVFDANGNLIEVDDGGVYRRTTPGGTGDWFSMCGNLQISEFHSVDWDSSADVAIAGAQDTGSSEQVVPGNAEWAEISQGDGGQVAVDEMTRADQDQSIRYSSFQFFQDFRGIVYDSANNFVDFFNPTLIVAGSGGQHLLDFDGAIQFYQPYVLNAVNPARGIIGTDRLYETTDQFDNLSDLTGENPTFITALAYGGFSGGVPNEEVIYYSADANVFVRTTSGGVFTNLTGYLGGTAQDMVLDADEWGTVYVIDSDQVFVGTGTGSAWTDITGNLLSLVHVTPLRTIEFVPMPSGNDMIIVGAAGGAFVSTTTDPGNWSELGDNLPNAVVFDVRYDAIDDLLIAGTLGRGAWTIPNLTAIEGSSPTVVMTSPSGDVTNDNPIPVTVTFSEGVTGFDESGIVAGSGTVENFSATSALVYTFDLVPSVTNGAVTADIPEGAATAILPPNLGNDAADQFSRLFDSVAPAVTVPLAGVISPTNDLPVAFTVGFDSRVFGLGGAVDLGSSTVGGTLSYVVSLDETRENFTYTIEVSGATGEGDVVADVNPALVTDAAGNTLSGSAFQATVHFDSVGPAVASPLTAPAEPTNVSPVEFDISFNEPVSGLASAIDLSRSMVGGTLTFEAVEPARGTANYLIRVSGATGQGTITVDIDPDLVTDALGNPVGGETLTATAFFDAVGPAVVSALAGPGGISNASPVRFSVVFDEFVNGLDGAIDLSLSTVDGTLTYEVIEPSRAPADYFIDVSGAVRAGDITVHIDTAQVTDTLGNVMGGAPLQASAAFEGPPAGNTWIAN